MLWDMHLCVFDVRLSFENRVPKPSFEHFCIIKIVVYKFHPKNFTFSSIQITSLNSSRSVCKPKSKGIWETCVVHIRFDTVCSKIGIQTLANAISA